MWIDSVNFDGSTDDLVVAILVEGSLGRNISANLHLTLSTDGAEGSKHEALFPVVWSGGVEGPATFRLKLGERLLPTIASRLELSISDPRGASIKDSTPKVLWSQENLENFSLRSQCILHLTRASTAVLR